MRKPFALLLVLLILFNSVGYYGVLSFLRYRSSVRLLEKLEMQAGDGVEILTVQIPLSIPYMPDRTDFEIVRGELEHNGQYYGAARQKYERDTLTVTYYKDQHLTYVHQSFRDFVKQLTDTPESGPKGKTAPVLIKDFIVDSIGINVQSTGWARDLHAHQANGQCRPPHYTVLLPPPLAA